MNPDEIEQKANEKLNKKLIKDVFFLIQSNKLFMEKYQYVLEEKGLEFVNREIQLEVKKLYKLELKELIKLAKIKDREENPSSH
jgi:hypothetical protein